MGRPDDWSDTELPRISWRNGKFQNKEKSFKSKKVIIQSPENWSIFTGTQELIIDEETFAAVQKIREGKRKVDSLGEPSPFSGILYCGDCGHKLYLRRQRNPKQKDYFVCSVYRKKRKYYCTSHFIRLEDVEKIVLEDLRRVTQFARENKQEFLEAVKKRSAKELERLQMKNNAELDKALRRVKEIDSIIQSLYEDNVSGKINDERFEKMATTYETEQKQLQQKIDFLRKEISVARDEGESVERFFKLLNKYTDITEIDAEIIRTFIEKVIVYEAVQVDNVKTQKVKIIYNCVGAVSIPSEITVQARTKTVEAA